MAVTSTGEERALDVDPQVVEGATSAFSGGVQAPAGESGTSEERTLSSAYATPTVPSIGFIGSFSWCHSTRLNATNYLALSVIS